MLVRTNLLRRNRFKLGEKSVQLAVGGFEVETLEPISDTASTCSLGKPQALLLARDVNHVNTLAMRSRVGKVGKSLPRSSFESIAGESPVCLPSSTKPMLFRSLSVRSFSPNAYGCSPSRIVLFSDIAKSLFSCQYQDKPIF